MNWPLLVNIMALDCEHALLEVLKPFFSPRFLATLAALGLPIPVGWCTTLLQT